MQLWGRSSRLVGLLAMAAWLMVTPGGGRLAEGMPLHQAVSGQESAQSMMVPPPAQAQVAMAGRLPNGLAPAAMQWEPPDSPRRSGPPLPTGPGTGRRAAVMPPESRVIPAMDPAAIAAHFVITQQTPLGAIVPAANNAVVNEPSAANNGNLVFLTGNRYAAFSSDGGQTFVYVDPFSAFPAVYGGFCCDQVVIYDEHYDLMFWLLLYAKDSNNNNSLRLAVARGQAKLASGNWYYYDLTPQQLGYPSGHQFDYPHLALGSNYIYLTVNIFNSNDAWAGTVIERLPLDQIASENGLNVDYFVSTTTFNFTPVQGASTTIYWASHLSTSSLRLYEWSESNRTIAYTDVTVSRWPNEIRRCPGPDQRDWCGRSSGVILAGWLAQGKIGFLWNASQGTGDLGTFPFPYVHAAIFDPTTKALLGEPVIWNANYAFIYPAIGVNRAGEIAGSLFFGGGADYPTLALLIQDAASPVSPPWEIYAVAASTSGPTQNRWGDYLAARPHAPDGIGWVATGYYLADIIQPLYLWFGRAARSPVTVDSVWTRDGYADVDKTSFQPGESIRYVGLLNNPTGMTQTVRLASKATGPGGTLFDQTEDRPVLPGLSHWALSAVLPNDLAPGSYTFTLRATDGNSISARSTTFTILPLEDPRQEGPLQVDGILQVGQRVSLTVAIKNYGNVTTRAFYPYMEGTNPAGQFWRADSAQPPAAMLPPGQVVSFTLLLDLASAGTWVTSGVYLWDTGSGRVWQPLPANGQNQNLRLLVAAARLLLPRVYR